MKNIQKRKRLTLVLRTDLIDRVKQTSSELKQNPNSFVNLCVEGVLAAMETDDDFAVEIPIVQLWNAIRGKNTFTRKVMMTLCAAIIPQFKDFDPEERRFFIRLINRHKGGFSPQILSGYCELAKKMNLERMEHERQLATFLSVL